MTRHLPFLLSAICYLLFLNGCVSKPEVRGQKSEVGLTADLRPLISASLQFGVREKQVFAAAFGEMRPDPARSPRGNEGETLQRAAAAAVPPTGYVNRLAWSQPDSCAGWIVTCQTNGVIVTNIVRPFFGHAWTNTIHSPFGGLHTVRAYRR